MIKRIYRSPFILLAFSLFMFYAWHWQAGWPRWIWFAVGSIYSLDFWRTLRHKYGPLGGN